MNSLDPVYTIKQQFVEVLKEHDYTGDSEKLILDSINSVNLDESVPKKLTKLSAIYPTSDAKGKRASEKAA